jgi:hypothetical protein
MKIPLSVHNRPFSAVAVPEYPRKMSLYSLFTKQSMVTELTMRFRLNSHKVNLVYRHASCLSLDTFFVTQTRKGFKEEENRRQV